MRVRLWVIEGLRLSAMPCEPRHLAGKRPRHCSRASEAGRSALKERSYVRLYSKGEGVLSKNPIDELLRGAPGQGPAWARRLRQDRRLRHLRAAGPRLYRDRPGLLEAHPPGHHPRPGRPAHRHQLRWLARLPRPGRPRLWPRPRRPCPRRVHQRHRPYQRHRRLLGPGQGPADPIQRPAETHLPPPSQGDRMGERTVAFRSAALNARKAIPWCAGFRSDPYSRPGR